MFFSDVLVANAILNADTPYEAKRLSYQINRVNNRDWHDHGHDICIKGVREIFTQNPDLLNMLKATAPLTIAEASNDRVWGTGIPLWDRNALICDKWESQGWLSKMLHSVREEPS